MNDVAISGRLTRTPVTHKYKDSVVCNFTIALNEFPQNNSTFVDCVAWGTIADNLAKYQEKGDMIEVTGYIISQYDKNDEFPCNKLKVGCKSIIYIAKSEKHKKIRWPRCCYFTRSRKLSIILSFKEPLTFSV